MSEELAQFLAEYLTWAGDTENADVRMDSGLGLCLNTMRGSLATELMLVLSKFTLPKEFPFSNGNYGNHLDDVKDRSLHLNPKRIIWTRRALLEQSLNLAIPIFLRDWLKWAVTGEQPTGAEFVKESGLCQNFVLWTDPDELYLEHEGVSTCHYYHRLGKWAGWGKWDTPFNNEVPYGSESDCTLNPARRAFALTHAKTLYTQTPDWMKNV